MDIQKRREQLLKSLAEQRDIQQQAALMLDNARAAEHQLLGGIAIIDELMAEQAKIAGQAAPEPPQQPHSEPQEA